MRIQILQAATSLARHRVEVSDRAQWGLLDEEAKEHEIRAALACISHLESLGWRGPGGDELRAHLSGHAGGKVARGGE